METEKKLVITIGKDGSVRSEAFGFKGRECEEKSEWIDNLFGIKQRKHKESYNEEKISDGNISDGLPSGWCG